VNARTQDPLHRRPVFRVPALQDRYGHRCGSARKPVRDTRNASSDWAASIIRPFS
jgi:hypothetical protein